MESLYLRGNDENSDFQFFYTIYKEDQAITETTVQSMVLVSNNLQKKHGRFKFM